MVVSWRGILFAVALGVSAQVGAATLSEDIRVSPPPVGAPLTRQGAPNVAFGGGVYLVVWDDDRNGNSDIYGARVKPDGTVLDPEGFPISTQAQAEKTPAVAFDGTRFLVVWVDARNCCLDVYGSRVDPDGTVLDPQGLLVSKGQTVLLDGRVIDGLQSSPDVAAGGGAWVVTWGDARMSLGDIYAVRLTPEGQVLDSKDLFLSRSGFDNESNPRLAFNGTDFLVVYDDYFGSRNGSVDTTSASRLGVDGTSEVLSLAGLRGTSPAVASGGGSFLLASRSGPTLTTFLLQQDGTPRASSIPAANDKFERRGTAVTFDGDYFLVAWTDNTAGDILGVQVKSDGTVLGSHILGLATGASVERQPRLASEGSGRSLVVFGEGEPDGSGQSVERIHARFVENDLRGAKSCADDTECGSGFCVDGVCCATACGGGDPQDCEACSLAAGAAQDGTCGPVAERVCLPPDAGAETPDAGVENPDAGMEASDAGQGVGRKPGGGGCTTAGGAGTLALALALLSVVALARRRAGAALR